VLAHHQLGQAEVEDFHLAHRRQHEVVGLDVAVDHAALEGMLEAQGRLADVVTGVRHRQWALPLEHVGQAQPRHELHDEHVQVARLLRVVGGDDIRVGQLGRGLDLAAEALQGVGVGEYGPVDHLDGNLPVHRSLLRLVDDAHAALAQLAQEAVARVVRELLRHPLRRGGGCHGLTHQAARGAVVPRR
jgi:hypothetical protein